VNAQDHFKKSSIASENSDLNSLRLSSGIQPSALPDKAIMESFISSDPLQSNLNVELSSVLIEEPQTSLDYDKTYS
jgi:hypothetical protein